MQRELNALREERYNSFDKNIKNKIDAYHELSSSKYQLNVIKRTRPSLKKGDVFALSPVENLYFLGIILNCNVNNENSSNLAVIVIYNITVSSLDEIHEGMLDFSPKNILLGPTMLPKYYWTNGLFYNIGKTLKTMPQIDYGFCKYFCKYYLNEYGETIDHKPEILGYWGIDTIIGIAYDLNYELIVDHSFLPEEHKKICEAHIERMLSETKETQEELDLDEAEETLLFHLVKGQDGDYAVVLEDFSDIEELIHKKNESLEGNGYDWEDVVRTYIEEHHAEEISNIEFDSEADMMYVYSQNYELMKSIAENLSELIKNGKIEEYIMRTNFNDLV